MLVLSRRKNEAVLIDDQIEVEVLEIRGNRVRLGIRAPEYVRIVRAELPMGKRNGAERPRARRVSQDPSGDALAESALPQDASMASTQLHGITETNKGIVSGSVASERKRALRIDRRWLEPQSFVARIAHTVPNALLSPIADRPTPKQLNRDRGDIPRVVDGRL